MEHLNGPQMTSETASTASGDGGKLESQMYHQLRKLINVVVRNEYTRPSAVHNNLSLSIRILVRRHVMLRTDPAISQQLLFNAANIIF